MKKNVAALIVFTTISVPHALNANEESPLVDQKVQTLSSTHACTNSDCSEVEEKSDQLEEEIELAEQKATKEIEKENKELESIAEQEEFQVSEDIYIDERAPIETLSSAPKPKKRWWQFWKYI